MFLGVLCCAFVDWRLYILVSLVPYAHVQRQTHAEHCFVSLGPCLRNCGPMSMSWRPSELKHASAPKHCLCVWAVDLFVSQSTAIRTKTPRTTATIAKRIATQRTTNMILTGPIPGAGARAAAGARAGANRRTRIGQVGRLFKKQEQHSGSRDPNPDPDPDPDPGPDPAAPVLSRGKRN